MTGPDPAARRLEVWGVTGLPEVCPGDDLAELVAKAKPGLQDGDVVVVTSKVVSKAEGRIWTGDRQAAITAEAVRVVAARGDTRIVVTRQGYVLAAAGVDASNVAPGRVLLLPEDPDASARRIRAGLAARLGLDVGVVVSDTFGRPWRVGLTDVALGVAGLAPLTDLRGQQDQFGNRLDVTVTAVADEVAAAAELVKGKLAGVPVAVVRGLPGVGGPDGPGGQAMIRPPEEDMFPLGAREAARAAVRAGVVGHRLAGPVPAALLHAAAEAAEQVVVVAARHLAPLAEAVAAAGGPAAELAAAPALLAVLATGPGPAAVLAGARGATARLALAAEGLGSWWWLPEEPSRALARACAAGPPARVAALIATGWPAGGPAAG